jgi:uncharacterized RDD family membrane protein YckC
MKAAICRRVQAAVVAALLALVSTVAGQEAPDSAARVREQVERALERSRVLRSQSPHGEIVRVGEKLTVKEGEVAGDAVVLFADARVDGEVRDLVVILGSATLGPTALVKGDCVVLGGDLKADAKSEARRDVVVVGGELIAPDDALVRQRARVIPLDFKNLKIWPEDWAKEFPHMKMAVDWTTQGLMLGRPLPPSLGWVWNVAAVFVFIHVLLAVLFPRPVQACVNALDRQPVGAFFAGLLGLVLAGPVLVVLAFTGVGLLVVPFIVGALGVGMVFGKVAVYCHAGQQLGRQTGAGFLQKPLLALLAGTVLLHVLYVIPVVGLVAWAVLTTLGMGNATLALFSGMRRKESVATPHAPPAAAEPGSTPPLLQVASAWPRAGFWRRAMAMAMDAVLVLVPVLVLAGMFRTNATPVLLLLAWLGYHLALWTTLGTTVGGMAMRVKMVREDGRPMGFAVSLVRALASVFSALVLFVGFFWAGWSRQKRSWHDFIAGTIVVKVPRGVAVA